MESCWAQSIIVPRIQSVTQPLDTPLHQPLCSLSSEISTSAPGKAHYVQQSQVLLSPSSPTMGDLLFVSFCLFFSFVGTPWTLKANP